MHLVVLNAHVGRLRLKDALVTSGCYDALSERAKSIRLSTVQNTHCSKCGSTEHRSSTCPTAAQNAVIPEAAVREAQARELEKKRKTGTAAAAGVVAVRVVVSSSNHSSSYRNRRCVSHRTCKSNICNWR